MTDFSRPPAHIPAALRRGGADSDQPELRAVREHAEQLAQGQGALVMWFGQRGAGKTRLLHQATNLVTEVVPHVRTINVPGESVSNSTVAGVSAMLVHSLDLPTNADTELVDDVMRDRQERRITDAELLRAAANIGRVATATRPILVLIDDLPYFSIEDVSALAILAARIAEFPLLIMCTSSYALSEDRSMSAFGPLWMRPIAPLSPAGAWSIATTYGAGFVPPTIAARIGRLGGGLPGDIIEIVKSLSPAELRGEVPLPSPVQLSTPTVSEARAWLAGLDDRRRRLVVAAAHDPFHDRDRLESDLDASMESAGRGPDDRWFVSDQAHYDFAEPRLRAAVLAVAPRRDVLGTHRALAEAAPAGSTTEAWHRLRAGEVLEDEELASLEASAREQLDTGDLTLAYTLAHEGLTVARGEELRCRLSFTAGLAAMHLGHLESAYEELTAAVTTATDDATLATAVDALVLTVIARDGSLPVSIIDSAIARLRTSSPHLALHLAALAARSGVDAVSSVPARGDLPFGHAAAHAEDHGFSLHYLRVAEEVAKDVTDENALFGLRFASIYLGHGDLDDARTLADPFAATHERGDVIAWDRSVSRVEILRARGDLEGAQLAVADLRARFTRLDSPMFLARVVVGELRIQVELGHLKRAVSVARDTMYETPLHLVGPGMGVALCAEIFTLAGLTDLGDQWTGAARLAGHSFATPQLRASVPALLSQRAEIDGDLQSAAEQAVAAAQHMADLGAPPWHRVFVERLEHQYLIGHDQTGAPLTERIDAALADVAEPDAEQLTNRSCAWMLTCPTGEVVAALYALVRHAEGLANPLSRARALLTGLRALHRVDADQYREQAKAIAQLPAEKSVAFSRLVTRAAAAAQEAGADGLVPVIRRVTPSPSGTTSATPGSPVRAMISQTFGDHEGDALSAEERTVAQMVVAGASNKQVAAALYVSVRTVELRLTSIYRKLGISSRKELPRAMSTRETPTSGRTV